MLFAALLARLCLVALLLDRFESLLGGSPSRHPEAVVLALRSLGSGVLSRPQDTFVRRGHGDVR
jgi:hypothetical protein